MKLDRCVSTLISEEQVNVKNTSYLVNIECWERKFGKESHIHRMASQLGLPKNAKVALSNNSSVLTVKERPTQYTEQIKQWMLATSDSDIEKVQNLAKENPYLINTRDPLWGMTALHWAVKNDNYSMVEYLCDLGANINTQSCTGETPLHLAVKLKRFSIYRYLTKCPNLERSILDNHGRKAESFTEPPKSSGNELNTSNITTGSDSAVSSFNDFDLSEKYSESSIHLDHNYSVMFNQSSFENKHYSNVNIYTNYNQPTKPLNYTKSFEGHKSSRLKDLINKCRNKLTKRV